VKSEILSRNIGRHVQPQAVLDKIEGLLGLRYLPHQWSDLLRLLKPAMREFGFTDTQECLVWLERQSQSEEDIRILAKHLTIGESYFFREIVVFKILQEHILPEIIERKRKNGDTNLRVWSAGCSTGEEVYSIAIVLADMIAQHDDMNVSILGTDVNPISIERAKRGRYREWSFRDMNDDFLKQWFTVDGESRYWVSDVLRDMVEFRVLNLVNRSEFPSRIDIVFCRNVLLYFTRKAVKDIVFGFRRSLCDHGWLLPSMTETSLINQPGFEGVRFGDATLFRKQQGSEFMFRRSSSKAREVEQSGLSNIRSTTINEFSGNSTDPEPTATIDGHPDASSSGPERVQSEQSASIADANGDMSNVRDAVVDRENPCAVSLPSTVCKSSASLLAEDARRLADHGKLDEALSLVEEAVLNDKMNAHNHFILATVLRELGETTRALKSFEHALYLDQDMISAHLAIAAICKPLGRRERAKKHLQVARELLEHIEDQDAIVEHSEMSARLMANYLKTMDKVGHDDNTFAGTY